ncbi:unnamed protein product [Pseudo-nitzschia multistriata]|uniref:Peptidase A1 domain-containing protein n=1 Tax=Pseudo-nitzschia multistriata TaxID=183589 RepID=A0A448ZJM4_9STRA|nr:unnamed protein product [Pseudo-nitzschia multistriata]
MPPAPTTAKRVLLVLQLLGAPGGIAPFPLSPPLLPQSTRTSTKTTTKTTPSKLRSRLRVSTLGEQTRDPFSGEEGEPRPVPFQDAQPAPGSPQGLPRRGILAVAVASVAAAVPPPPVEAKAEAEPSGPFLAAPLEFVPALGAYVVRYTLFGEAFAAVVDTGSPFLTVPSYCRPYRNQKMRWGCYRPERTQDSGYANTVEGFDNNYGVVVWRKADFSFPGRVSPGEGPLGGTGGATDPFPVVFGVLGEDLLNGSGGVFFGLIKETDRWIRPSFLGQAGYASFCVDLRRGAADSTGPELVLSERSMIGTTTRQISGTSNNSGNISSNSSGKHNSYEYGGIADFVPLVRDLKTRYGAPVVHYTARASRFVVNGLPLLIDQRRKPLFVIFDTGVSGMVVSRDLFDGRYLQARKNREKSLWGSVEVAFRTSAGGEVVLSAEKPITTPLGKAAPWKGFRGNLVVVGLAFLDGLATTVDADDGKIRFDE